MGTLALAENEVAESEDGARLFRLAGGYATLVAELESQLDKSVVQVETSAVATHLRWRRHEVTIEVLMHDVERVDFAAAHAIVTIPLGNLKAEKGSEGAVRFDPEPPGWREAFDAFEMGAARRIVLRFDHPWWIEQNHEAPIFVHGHGEPFPVWWTASPPEVPLLTGWVGGKRGGALAGRSHQELVRLALDSAANIFGPPLGQLETQLRAAYTHDWSNDPFSRGAYSYGGVGASSARDVLARPIAGTVFLAGEVTAETGRNGTVHGAMASGVRAANDLLSEKLARPRH
jgi:monoamine oxidase